MLVNIPLLGESLPFAVGLSTNPTTSSPVLHEVELCDELLFTPRFVSKVFLALKCLGGDAAEVK